MAEAATKEAETEQRYHRVRFYPKVWSTFDEVLACKRPAHCWGCEYNHPACDKDGRVLSATTSP